MDPITLAIIVFLVLFLLLAIGLPIGFAMGVTGFVGGSILLGDFDAALFLLGQTGVRNGDYLQSVDCPAVYSHGVFRQ